MAIVTLNADGTYTKVADPSFLTNMVDGIKAPMLAENQALDADSSFWAALVYGGVGGVGLGYLARKRAEAGKDPIAGFIL